MAKVSFGEWSAFETRGGVRFQKGNLLIGEKMVPAEVVAFLKGKLGAAPRETIVPPVEPTFPMPTEEEKAKLLEESLQVPEHLKTEPALTEADFDEPTTGVAVNPAGPHPLPQASPEFLESISIHTAPLEAIAQALYERFGIYTVYNQQLPVADEINPLTGEMFTKYHLGIAYQSALAAASRGVFNQNPEEGRKRLDSQRAAEANALDAFETPAYTMGEGRKRNTFQYRTSVRGAQETASQNNGAVSRPPRGDEDEPILEPPIFGTTKVIRPDW